MAEKSGRRANESAANPENSPVERQRTIAGAGADCCCSEEGWVGALMCLSRKSGVPRIIRASRNCFILPQ